MMARSLLDNHITGGISLPPVMNRKETVLDQRGRDDPPIFYIPTQLAGYKYHALLMEPVAVSNKMLLDLHPEMQTVRQAEALVSVIRPRGLYGFQLIEERDKFCRRCNAAADAIEVRICIPVTVPNIFQDQPLTTTVRYTGPVTDNPKGTPK